MEPAVAFRNLQPAPLRTNAVNTAHSHVQNSPTSAQLNTNPNALLGLNPAFQGLDVTGGAGLLYNQPRVGGFLGTAPQQLQIQAPIVPFDTGLQAQFEPFVAPEQDGSQFGILGPSNALEDLRRQQPFPQASRMPDIRHDGREINVQPSQSQADNAPIQENAHLEGLKLVPSPPELALWRQRLFDVDSTIVMTQNEFQTYFPHVDNIYSHRSTQKYKRKPFVSHYWDCRLKGRPPGTPKSSDPNKKKRKRVARERDLCDVKIKITEYMPGAAPAELFMPRPLAGVDIDMPNHPGVFGLSASQLNDNTNTFADGTAWPARPLPSNVDRAQKFYTIQRVNGNGGNGKNDGIAGPHKHSLQESDRIKKNSVQRWLLKNEKDKKKSEVSRVCFARNSLIRDLSPLLPTSKLSMALLVFCQDAAIDASAVDGPLLRHSERGESAVDQHCRIR